jgi:hypothetical protein
MRSEQYDFPMVEDDPEDCMFMTDVFLELGYGNKVTMYASGEAFGRDLAELKSLSPLPSSLFLMIIFAVYGRRSGVKRSQGRCCFAKYPGADIFHLE